MQTEAQIKIDYLDKFNEAKGNDADTITIQMSNPSLRRYTLCYNYSFAVPTVEALNVIKKYSPIIEIGAGVGYWASLLAQINTDIIAFDNFSWFNRKESRYGFAKDRMFYPVKEGNSCSTNKYPERTLFICWPPYQNNLAYNALRNYSGKYFIYVGEGSGGCCGTDSFFDYLHKFFELEETCKIPNWIGIHDCLYVYKRKNNEPITGSVKFICEGLKISGFEDFVKNYCFMKDLKSEIVCTKGIIFATYKVKITGEGTKLQQAVIDIKKAINKYNGEE